jgi:long-chain fatty acid transport protein
VSKHVTALADASWTHWSRFEFLTVQIQNPASQASTQREDWDNTWRLSAGAEYDSLEKWVLRTGVAWDQSPVRTETRTPRIPDNDRWWLSFGGTYRWTDALSFDLGYTHIWVADARLNQTGATGDRLIGEYKDSSVDIVSFQANYRF